MWPSCSWSVPSGTGMTQISEGDQASAAARWGVCARLQAGRKRPARVEPARGVGNGGTFFAVGKALENVEKPCKTKAGRGVSAPGGVFGSGRNLGRFLG